MKEGEETTIDPAEQRLADEVSEIEGASASAVALITGQAKTIRDLVAQSTDFESLKANLTGYADRLDAAGTALAEAVAANPGT